MTEVNRQLLYSGLEQCTPSYPPGGASYPAGEPRRSEASGLGGFAEDLVRYIDEILLWNPRLGLIEGDERDIVIRHVLDSAAGLPVMSACIAGISSQMGREQPNTLHLADLGSGSGMPGLVIALWAKHFLLPEEGAPQLAVHLVEKQQRRCGFLKNAVALLGLKEGVRIRQMNSKDLQPGFHVVTSRAYTAVDPEELRFQQSLLAAPGAILAYKGRRENLVRDLGTDLAEKLQILPVSAREPGAKKPVHRMKRLSNC
ncbi:16S rRNA (guanine(527)-N(7))-methyltransferase RsmG [Salinispira pacifica]|uniref:Ribosomal RNA small subunit methyltransferase G n=1 Tax=Salinispira pacifica TaxID=1307761 RepID=V5WEV1_9SPIO|nr:RsmG family class I SAM-dependent methyltransferase [Salinispira pacifica]AHC13696.1 hypothetical protein L21SP2_0254 [Salinispira pacifica]